jgi:hypothetical protein
MFRCSDFNTTIGVGTVRKGGQSSVMAVYLDGVSCVLPTCFLSALEALRLTLEAMQ